MSYIFSIYNNSVLWALGGVGFVKYIGSTNGIVGVMFVVCYRNIFALSSLFAGFRCNSSAVTCVPALLSSDSGDFCRVDVPLRFVIHNASVHTTPSNAPV